MFEKMKFNAAQEAAAQQYKDDMKEKNRPAPISVGGGRFTISQLPPHLHFYAMRFEDDKIMLGTGYDDYVHDIIVVKIRDWVLIDKDGKRVPIVLYSPEELQWSWLEIEKGPYFHMDGLLAF